MSERSRELAQKHGQRSGKGTKTLSRFTAWARDKWPL